MIAEAALGAYYDRVQGVVSAHFHRKKVVIVGVGAGSYQAEKLARLGPAAMTLVDFDRVELPNLVRTVYTIDDLGRPKAEALADRITRVNPAVTPRPAIVDICSLDAEAQRDLFAGADLLIAGTDQFAAQALVNRWSQRLAIPALFIGIHDGAEGGRLIWSVPGLTPCYRCVASDRYEWFESRGQAATDMAAAHGGLVDIQFIDMVALKIAIAVLDREEQSSAGRFFQRMLGRTEVIVRTSPDYLYGNSLWDAILSDLPRSPKAFAHELKEQALLAMDTLWLRTEVDPDCPDCRARRR